MTESLILVVNPGSASRKYALFVDGIKKANINFEFEDDRVVGKINFNGQKQSQQFDDTDLSNVSQYVLPMLRERKVIDETATIQVIGVRLVAPSKIFATDQLVTYEIEVALEAIEKRAPLHVKIVMGEVQHLRTYLPEIPIVIISDSAFHSSKPDWATYYSFDVELAEKIDVKRYCFHGISVGSVANSLAEKQLLLPKTIVCHLGGGSSVTALLNGKSIDNTMGYTPLEGVSMATRTGNIDVSAALAIKRELQLSDDDLEKYLNKKSGLLGVSGASGDVRQLLVSEEQGNQRAKLALKIFVYKIQQAIGQMAASLGGVDCLVFTATIGERSFVIRERVLQNLAYLGFENNKEVNDATYEPKDVANIASSASKPVLVVKTNESAEIAKRAGDYINNMQNT